MPHATVRREVLALLVACLITAADETRSAEWTRVGAAVPIETVWDLCAVSDNEIYFTGYPSVYKLGPNGWTNPEIGGRRPRYWKLWAASSTAFFCIDYDTSGINWFDGTVWQELPQDSRTDLESVWGCAADDVYAVGYNDVLHFDGAKWSVIFSHFDRWPTSVWGAATDDVYVTGLTGGIKHFDGTEWLTVYETTTMLFCIWGSSRNDVFAGGSWGLILHFNGGGWTEMSSGISDGLTAIWGLGPADVFAGTWEGNILHYDGSEWTTSASGIGDSIAGFWGYAPDRVYAATTDQGLWFYDGNGWMPVDIPGGPAGYMAVWGSSASDIYALSSGVPQRMLHYSGTGWSDMRLGTVQPLTGLNGIAASDIYAVGERGTIVHFDGHNWTPVHGYGSMQEIAGTAADNVFAGGSFGKLLRFDGDSWTMLPVDLKTEVTPGWTAWVDDLWVYDETRAFAAALGRVLSYDGARWEEILPDMGIRAVWGADPEHVIAAGNGIRWFDGSRWTIMSAPPECSDVRDVWGTSWTNVLAVGRGGVVCRFDGSRWTKEAVGTPAEWRLVGGSSANDVFVAGTDGELRHFNGRDWEFWDGVGFGGLDFQAVWAGSRNQILAAGDRGKILQFDGNAWTLRDTPTTYWLASIWGFSSGEAVAGGDGGILLCSDGASWSVLDKLDRRVWGVWGPGPATLFAVGAGIIARYDGGVQTYAIHEPTAQLRGVWGASADNVYAVGDGGLILHSDGHNWTPMASGTEQDLTAISGWAPDDLLALGKDGHLLRFDGRTWSIIIDLAEFHEGFYTGLWGSSSGDVFIIGEFSDVLHVDGAAGVTQQEVAPHYLRGISGADGLTAVVGTHGTVLLRDPEQDLSGAELTLNQRIYHGGDPLRLSVRCFNASPERIVADLYVLLDLGLGEYWFWPGWEHWPPAASSTPLALQPDTELTFAVLDFVWPEMPGALLPGLHFWAALIGRDGTVSGRFGHAQFAFQP